MRPGSAEHLTTSHFKTLRLKCVLESLPAHTCHLLCRARNSSLKVLLKFILSVGGFVPRSTKTQGTSARQPKAAGLGEYYKLYTTLGHKPM